MAGTTFHAGEQALQQRSGLRERLEAIGEVVIRDHMPDQHRELFGKLPTLLVAVQDDDGQPWVTMLHGPAGFISSPDPRTLRVATLPAPDDPVSRGLAEGAAIGALGLEPHTRRRNRANGQVHGLDGSGFSLQVLQSFGNCPKYIHGREPESLPLHAVRPAQHLGATLSADALALIRRADTLFIASASGARPGSARADGIDVSHRGGPPGFVQVTAAPEGVRLTLPDYLGNHFFNTLGNLQLWPGAGLLVVDYADGSLLHLAARATIDFDAAARAPFPGAQRLLHLDVQQAWWRPQALPLRWSAPQAPPQFGG